MQIDNQFSHLRISADNTFTKEDADAIIQRIAHQVSMLQIGEAYSRELGDCLISAYRYPKAIRIITIWSADNLETKTKVRIEPGFPYQENSDLWIAVSDRETLSQKYLVFLKHFTDELRKVLYT